MRYSVGWAYLPNISPHLNPPRPGRKKDAFTLAEVLITLVIIGVIAAITVPTLIIKHQKEQTVVRLKKEYSALAQALTTAARDYGSTTSWEIYKGSDTVTIDGVEYTGSEHFLNKYVVPYVAIAKNCGNSTEGDCSFTYKTLNGTNGSQDATTISKIYLNDGTLVAVATGVNDNESLANFVIDINGQKKPNKVGRDVFFFNYTLKHIDPIRAQNHVGRFFPWAYSWSREQITGDEYEGCCNKSQKGMYCAALIMRDMWQIKDDYPW
ncbi:type II secretion system protein [bacterium]|nr:type II secretion system protein [bacterium]